MRLLPLDAGREGAPLFIAARKRSWRVELLDLLRAAHGSRTYLLAALTRSSTLLVVPHEHLRAA